MDFNYTLKSSKVCCRCKQEFPLTTEFFHVANFLSDGFNSHCKTCRKKSYHLRRSPVQDLKKALTQRFNDLKTRTKKKRVKYDIELDFNIDCLMNLWEKQNGKCDVILSESYRQNHFSTDFRIREITQGYDILNAAGVSRLGLYDRIYLQHNVPRLYNPTGTFDNDQYLLEIVVPVGDPDGIFLVLATWLAACNSPCAVLDTPLGRPCDAPLVPIPGDAIPVPPVLP